VWVKDVEDRATLAEREAQERVLRVEAESTVAVAFALEETDGLVRKIALLEGVPTEVRRAHKVAEETSHGLSDTTADAKQWQEDFERGRREQMEELTLL
jgi:hypothetical protein